jgi:protocatechuate 3,4-dioxygenase beta subunit
MGSSIAGTVKDDDGVALAGVEITLLDSNGSVVGTTTTGAGGDYEVGGLPPGEYTVVEVNPADYPTDISDQDKSPDGDAAENTTGTVVDNEIHVTLQPGEAENGNNFIDRNKKGTISGNVTDPDNVPLPGATITLKDSQ